MRKRVNWPIAALGLVWWAMETSYFGWNSSPESIEELYADGAALLFYAIALAFPPRHPASTCLVVISEKAQSAQGGHNG